MSLKIPRHNLALKIPCFENRVSLFCKGYNIAKSNVYHNILYSLPSRTCCKLNLFLHYHTYFIIQGQFLFLTEDSIGFNHTVITFCKQNIT